MNKSVSFDASGQWLMIASKIFVSAGAGGVIPPPQPPPASMAAERCWRTLDDISCHDRSFESVQLSARKCHMASWSSSSRWHRFQDGQSYLGRAFRRQGLDYWWWFLWPSGLAPSLVDLLILTVGRFPRNPSVLSAPIFWKPVATHEWVRLSFDSLCSWDDSFNRHLLFGAWPQWCPIFGLFCHRGSYAGPSQGAKKYFLYRKYVNFQDRELSARGRGSWPWSVKQRWVLGTQPWGWRPAWKRRGDKPEGR